MDERRTANGWISLPVVDPTAVAVLRDRLYGWLAAPEPYRRADDPHVSVFGIRLPADRVAAFEREFRTFSEAVGGWRGRAEGYHLYPSARNPMVVALDVPLAIERFASPIADLLADNGGRVGRGPTPAHVTLLKGGVRGEELQWAQLDDRTRARLAAVVDDTDDRKAATDDTDDRNRQFDPPASIVAPEIRIELGPPTVTWN